MKLNYVLPNGSVVETAVAVVEEPWYVAWLHHVVSTNPEIIFFYTVETTDIWEPEEPAIDFNTVAYNYLGTLQHTYNPDCPDGCFGQFDDCSYKKSSGRPEKDG